MLQNSLGFFFVVFVSHCFKAVYEFFFCETPVKIFVHRFKHFAHICLFLIIYKLRRNKTHRRFLKLGFACEIVQLFHYVLIFFLAAVWPLSKLLNPLMFQHVWSWNSLFRDRLQQFPEQIDSWSRNILQIWVAKIKFPLFYWSEDLVVVVSIEGRMAS